MQYPQPPDKDTGGMAFYKDGRAGGADPDTGRKRCERQGHPPDLETFLKEGSRRQLIPTIGDSESSDIQVKGIISEIIGR